MLKRVELIQGVGLFHDANGAPFALGASSLIYAGNGRGKSTLCEVLRSVAAGDGTVIEERKTIDGTLDPRVVLQFDSGHRVDFSTAWSEVRPEFRIFDTTFIDENVFSGPEVTPDNRKNLLDFALGDKAVVARRNEEQAVRSQQSASAAIAQVLKEIAAVAGAMTPPVFRKLKKVFDSESQRRLLQKRRADAVRIASIIAQPLPKQFDVIRLDLDEVFRVLGMTLDNVHAEAEELVSEHVSKLRGSNAAEWLSEGLTHDDGQTCPYCGQGTIEIQLIRMYQQHFNRAYVELKDQVAATVRLVEQATSPAILSEFWKHRDKLNEQLGVWKTDVDVDLLSTELDALAEVTLTNLRDYLFSQLSQKLLALGEDLGGEEARRECERLWRQFVSIFNDQNHLIVSFIDAIDSFKAAIVAEDVSKLDAAIADIDLAALRHSPAVIDMFDRLATAETQLRDAESDKSATRGQLTAVMTGTLDRYRSDINRHLANLGAAFSIDEIRTNYFGGAPRSDYGILLRGKTVRLSGGIPSFATVLSEGDKRTLAFAFFVASTLADPDIANQIVVIDDPVSSLDRSRRECTTELLVEISKKCQQLILLAHDANFLRETRGALEKATPGVQPTSMQIVRVQEDYSNFGPVDLDRECETPYYSNYRCVDEFVDGIHSDARSAATALRPLLEGFLHRRFPGKLASQLMLGSAIAEIESAIAPSPLIHMKPDTQELRDLNTFAGKYHHDTNPGYQSHIADSASVATYSRRVLNVIHGA